MAERVLFQVWVEGDAADRLNGLRERFGLTMAEMTRRALLELAERLERLPAPFEAERGAAE